MENNDFSNLELVSPWTVYQGEEWKRVREASGRKSVIITTGEGAPKSRILCFEQELKTPLGVKKILFAEGFPLFIDEDSLKEVILEFKRISKKYFYGVIAPTVLSNREELFTRERYSKVSNYTVLIDLSLPEKELFQRLEKKSSRWGVKFAEKNNLSFQEIKWAELKFFYDMYLETTLEGNFHSENYSFFEELFKSKIGKIFLVKKGEKILAGGAILLDKDYAILNLTSSNEEGHKFQAMPFLYWNLIKYVKSTGRKYFDLGGYDKEARKGDKTFNINKFKERFGGEIVEQPVYSTSKKYFLLRKILKKFKFMKGAYKKE